jgi:RAT1-interacting protein
MNVAVFTVVPVERFAGSNAAIRRPKVGISDQLSWNSRLTLAQEISCFSYDEEHRFRLDDSSLRYYYPPCLPADLNGGFDTFQRLDDTADEHLDALLDTIVALEREDGANCEADIITWRGMMTKVCRAKRLGRHSQ